MFWSVLAATIVGGFLRFANLDLKPLWIDEAALGLGFLSRQEYIGNVLIVHNDWWMRLPYAIAGTLTIPAAYFVTRRKQTWVCWIIAIFPLFVFWSRLARPYAIVGLYVVLAWRWWWAMGFALLQSPSALLGVNFISHRWWKTAICAALAVYFYFQRGDVGLGKDFLNTDFLFNNPRVWYAPILAGLLYLNDYLLPRVFDRHPVRSEGDSERVVGTAGVVQ
jgi:hypothetical protein